MATSFIAFGSNLGDVLLNLQQSAALLDARPDIRMTKSSSIYETDPVGPTDQPRFFNAVAQIETELSATDLLGTLLATERALGRSREDGERWGPRTIDLDLLFYDDDIRNGPGLTVPHPRLHQRLFVLVPLCEIAATFVHPVSGRMIQSIYDDCRMTSNEQVRRVPQAHLMHTPAPEVESC